VQDKRKSMQDTGGKKIQLEGEAAELSKGRLDLAHAQRRSEG